MVMMIHFVRNVFIEIHHYKKKKKSNELDAHYQPSKCPFVMTDLQNKK